MSSFFELVALDKKTRARAGILHTAHGDIMTPVFMPVGTQGSVKTLSPDELVRTGSQIILGNTYHLYLRPGTEVIECAGGLQRFSSWNRPVLTDSGGYQVHSLAGLRKVTADGVIFQSHIDGSYHEFTPESTTDIQTKLGADIMMVLDECPPYPCEEKYTAEAVARTTAWARRCHDHFEEHGSRYGYHQSMFGIVQGGVYHKLREESAGALIDLNFPGYAIGGLSIGEPKPLLFDMVDACTGLLPHEKPRYLMGMGKPEDLVEGIALGVDMFDCVLPTRNARKGQVFTWGGAINLRNAKYKTALEPIEEACSCYACQKFTRAYIKHLLQAQEILGMRLASLHNIHFYHSLVEKCRSSINAGRFEQWRAEFYDRYHITNTKQSAA